VFAAARESGPVQWAEREVNTLNSIFSMSRLHARTDDTQQPQQWHQLHQNHAYL
jgi:hypothetical protein